MSEPAVSVRGLVKKYGDHAAVDDVDLEVQQGECVALLGPNGAGKTTTVEILEGYRARTAGEVLILGHDPAHPTSEWRSRIGIVLQTAKDNADLNVAEVVSHFARYYPNPRDPAEVIEAVGLTDSNEVRTRNLSGGQRRRLDVALGIIGRPEVLFLDEPTTGFDPEARRAFWTLVTRLRADGTTILLTTHYLDEAEHLADRVAVISNGKIVAEGDPTTLGGRNSAAVTVTWATPDGMQSRRTTEPTHLVTELAKQFGGEVPELSVRRPSLEDVYLGLVGKPTADDDAPWQRRRCDYRDENSAGNVQHRLAARFDRTEAVLPRPRISGIHVLAADVADAHLRIGIQRRHRAWRHVLAVLHGRHDRIGCRLQRIPTTRDRHSRWNAMTAR